MLENENKEGSDLIIALLKYLFNKEGYTPSDIVREMNLEE